MTPATDRHAIASGGVSATIDAAGAELVSLAGRDGAKLLWQAGPEWPRHAPVLFPIVGRLAGHRLRHQARDYSLTQHGFARDSAFAWVERGPACAVLRLEETAATLARYPFRFILDMTYAAAGDTLSVTACVTNPADTVLPFAIGAHPAFNWPLVPGIAKDDHRLVFEVRPPTMATVLQDGLLAGQIDLPLEGQSLALSDGLFAQDALIFPDVRSRSVRFVAKDARGGLARALSVAWEGYRDLGLWSKPGAAFLCIEPWFGMASPVGWDGDFTQKPGIAHLGPGESRSFTWSVAIET